MIKSKKIINFLFFFALLGTVPAVAQTQPMQPQQQQKIEVNDAELQKFAKAYQQMRMVNQEAQKKMMALVKEEGFEIKRFNEIHKASLDPNKEIEMTEEEKEMHADVVEDLGDMQKEFQEKMEEVIEEQGLSLKRYEQLAMALRSDRELQQRLQNLMQG
ncbi:DUF4168 domain-containing protein [Salegentibacter chungangensis]|uniref:DUF4168 domain-containing protein n=1 Tax=Salegentibacter chungangensis TaxID=1335724 RepID=A0ABW3NSS8_9FLAO